MGSQFVPYFSYRDAPAALTWLERAFGFETKADYRDDEGVVQHAEMAFGDARLMMGTGDPPSLGGGGLSPTAHGVYVVVEDVDAHHGRAQEAGAEIVYPPEDTEFGTRRYRALDIEGYEWSFGTYQPG